MSKSGHLKTLALSVPASAVHEALTTHILEWWSSDFAGKSVCEGDEFTVRFGETYKTMRIAEATPERITWLCVAQRIVMPEGMAPLRNDAEWVGQSIHWTLRPTDFGTELTFFHEGLTPDAECWHVCEPGWDQTLQSLCSLLESGVGSPFEKLDAEHFDRAMRTQHGKHKIMPNLAQSQKHQEAFRREFSRQVAQLAEIGYPAILDMSEAAFTEALAPLNCLLNDLSDEPFLATEGKLPFVIVISSKRLDAEVTMPLVSFHGTPGIVCLQPRTATDFHTREDVPVPGGFAYLLLGVDRGNNTLNMTPELALQTIRQDGRSPLTISEGIAIITQFPDFLRKNHCFSLLASRCDDQRVPAIWISEKRPKLGWCWDRNPHTWLGSASCNTRIR